MNNQKIHPQACYVILAKDLERVKKTNSPRESAALLAEISLDSFTLELDFFERRLDAHSVGPQFDKNKRLVIPQFAQKNVYAYLNIAHKKRATIEFLDFPDLKPDHYSLMVKSKELLSNDRGMKIRKAKSQRRAPVTLTAQENFTLYDKRKRRKKLLTINNSNWLKRAQEQLGKDLDRLSPQNVIDELSGKPGFETLSTNRKTVGKQIVYNRSMAKFWESHEASVKEHHQKSLSTTLQHDHLVKIMLHDNDGHALEINVSESTEEQSLSTGSTDLLTFNVLRNQPDHPFKIQLHYSTEKNPNDQNALINLSVEPVDKIKEVDLEKEAILPGFYIITVIMEDSKGGVQQTEHLLKLRERLFFYDTKAS